MPSSPLPTARSSLVPRQRFCQIFPSHQNESLVLEKFLKFRTLHHIKIMLAPSSAPVRMIEGGAPHFVIVMGKVKDDLVNAWSQGHQLFFVPVRPVFRVHARRNFHHAIQQDLLW